MQNLSRVSCRNDDCCVCDYAAIKKRKGGGVGGSSLSEEERDVIDLSHTEAAMQASVTALKKEYTINLVTRLTPGLCVAFVSSSPYNETDYRKRYLTMFA